MSVNNKFTRDFTWHLLGASARIQDVQYDMIHALENVQAATQPLWEDVQTALAQVEERLALDPMDDMLQSARERLIRASATLNWLSECDVRQGNYTISAFNSAFKSAAKDLGSAANDLRELADY
jgi:hypothetical protein